MGKMIDLVATDGFRLSAYRADPAGESRGGVVVAQEIFGVNSHIKSVCDGFAKEGYVAVAPALFDRYERGVDIGYTGEDIARGRALKAKATTEGALLDVTAARDALSATGKVGVVGYCWGGLVSWMSACRLAGFACAVTYYGGGMLEAIAETPKCLSMPRIMGSIAISGDPTMRPLRRSRASGPWVTSGAISVEPARSRRTVDRSCRGRAEAD